jgi:hypothetical protein
MVANGARHCGWRERVLPEPISVSVIQKPIVRNAHKLITTRSTMDGASNSFLATEL